MEVIQFSDISKFDVKVKNGKILQDSLCQKTIMALQKEVFEIRTVCKKAGKNYDVIRELYVNQEILSVSASNALEKKQAQKRIREIRKALIDAGKDADSILDNFFRQSCYLMLDVHQVRQDNDTKGLLL